jgi:lipopolysaccharide/colanic/teichoic acid biosynthesis glycosyltransferase
MTQFNTEQLVMRRVTLLLIDLILISLSTIFALALRDNFESDLTQLPGLKVYLLITLGIAIPVLMLLGLNRSVWRFSALSDYLRVVAAAVAITVAAMACGFIINRLEGVARAVPVLQGLLIICLLVGARVLMRLRHSGRRSALAKGEPALSGAQETVLVLGLNSIAELYIRSIAEFAGDRTKIAGLIGRSDHQRGRLLQQYNILGGPESISSIVDTLSIHGVVVDRIVVAVPLQSLTPVAKDVLYELSRNSNVRLDFLADRIISPNPTGAVEGSGPEGARPALQEATLTFVVGDELLNGTGRPLFWALKRSVDVVAAAVLLVVLAPVFVVLTLCVLADVGFPAVFWQQRPGRYGRPFRLHKFRTMADAHDAQGNRIPDAARLSSFGRLMRRTRLDELPQLINILVGDMSFVGPRPLLPVDQSNESAARLLVRPGLTGWAQVIGGRAIGATDKAALDVWYVCNASFLLDLKILALTVPMVLLGERTNMAAVRRAWSDLNRRGVCSQATDDSSAAPMPRPSWLGKPVPKRAAI